MEKLLDVAMNPHPFEKGTKEIWVDAERADYVLESHLNEAIPGGSKSKEFIAETVDFIKELVPVEQGKKVIDLGCGPGLYSHKLAEEGYSVVGIDFNEKSIEYAKKQAEEFELEIDYRKEDITKLGASEEQEYDLGLIIYQIFSVLNPEGRANLLNSLYKKMKSGGIVLLDVLSESSYENFQQNLFWSLSRKDNPLSSKKHLGLYAAMKYPDKVTLEKNVMVFGDGEIVNYNYWNQCFSVEDLKEEVNKAGFELVNVYGDVNGSSYDENRDFFAAVLRKK